MNTDDLDVHIEKLRKGNTLAENEVRALCEKVSFFCAWGAQGGGGLSRPNPSCVIALKKWLGKAEC